MLYEPRARVLGWRMLSAVSLCVTALASGAGSAASASVFVVTTAGDSGAGSLRQAINDANGSPGADTINFFVAGGGVQTISPLSALPAITDPVTIDGTTQPGFAGSPIIELNGTLAGASSFGLQVLAGSSTVRGLVVNRFASNGIELFVGGGNVVQGNFIGTDVSGTAALGNGGSGIQMDTATSLNLIGGTTPEARNVLSGNVVHGVGTGGSGNRVQGNFIGTDASGTAALGNQFGVAVGGTDDTVGGPTAEERNLISGNREEGVTTNATIRATIEGNYIGTDVTGILPVPNLSFYGGVSTDYNAEQTVVRGNLIAFNTANGVFIGSGTGHVVANNDIHSNGGDPNGGDGVILWEGAPGSVVVGNAISSNLAFGIEVHGSSNAITRNTITGNGTGGVLLSRLASPVVGNLISRNAIGGNGGLGIDLSADGVTLNDVRDFDEGPNRLQNFPVLSSIVVTGGTTTIDGTLNSRPNSTFVIELFADVAADPSGYGEGGVFIGSVGVTTNSFGYGQFSVVLPRVNLPFATATATDALRSTSEFSKAKPVPFP